jgi:hypothetical protein
LWRTVADVGFGSQVIPTLLKKPVMLVRNVFQIAVAPKIGHLKNDHRMRWCSLKGPIGGAINALSGGCGPESAETPAGVLAHDSFEVVGSDFRPMEVAFGVVRHSTRVAARASRCRISGSETKIPINPLSRDDADPADFDRSEPERVFRAGCQTQSLAWLLSTFDSRFEQACGNRRNRINSLRLLRNMPSSLTDRNQKRYPVV